MGAFGVNIIGVTLTTWLLYFYSPPLDSGRPIYLPITLIGILMTIANLWDSFIDPFIGQYNDNMRTRWGRRRVFMAIGWPVSAICLILIFSPPKTESIIFMALYFFIVRILFFTGESMGSVPYDSMIAEFTKDPDERVVLSSLKQIIGLGGVLASSVIAGLLFDSRGASFMAAVMAAIGAVCIVMAILSTKERYTVEKPSIGVVEGVILSFKNKQFILIALVNIFINTIYGMLVANLPYFVTLIAGGKNDDVSLYLGIMVIGMILSGFFWMWFSRKVPNKRIADISMVGMAVALAVMFFAGQLSFIPTQIFSLTCLVFVGIFLMGFYVIIYTIMGSVVDYDEMLNKERREGVFYGNFSLALSIGVSVSTIILPQIYNLFGYSLQNPLGVRIAFLVMGAFSFLGFLTFRWFKVKDTPAETRKVFQIPE